MNASTLLSAASILALAVSATFARPQAAHAAACKVVGNFQVGGDGRWDYITVDPDSHRLYVPRSTHVMVLDAENGKTLADWPDTAGVHGAALDVYAGLAFTSNGHANTVSVFDLKTDKKIADVKVGSGPDAILFDKASGNVIVFNHKGGTVTFIKVDADKKFATKDVEVGGALEAGVADDEGHVFVNVEDKNEIVELDSKAMTVLHHWPIKGGEAPTGIALDMKNHRLFAGCGDNNVMAVVDSNSGETLATVPIGEHCDGVAFDPASERALASCGDGTLSVVKEQDGKFVAVQSLPTKQGARTIAIDPKAHRIYMPTAEFGTPEAGKRWPPMKPGTFQIVVVEF